MSFRTLRHMVGWWRSTRLVIDVRDLKGERGGKREEKRGLWCAPL